MSRKSSSFVISAEPCSSAYRHSQLSVALLGPMSVTCSATRRGRAQRATAPTPAGVARRRGNARLRGDENCVIRLCGCVLERSPDVLDGEIWVILEYLGFTRASCE